MSTVDAAIINYIIGGGGSSGGGGGGESGGGGGESGGGSSDVAKYLENEYGTLKMDAAGANGALQYRSKTRGLEFQLVHADAIDIPFGIGADYSSNYPRLYIMSPNFELEATKNGQTGKSLTTLTSADFYTEGNLTVKEGFAFSAPNIYTKQEVDTMFATGGNTDVDTMTRISGQTYFEETVPGGSGGVYVYIQNIHKKYMKTGLIVKLNNTRSEETESYVLIKKSDDLSKDIHTEFSDPNTGNAILVSLTSNRVVPVAIGAATGAQYGIRITASVGVYGSTTSDENHGVFEIDHMSHSTLVKIACNYHTTYDQSV